MDSEFLALLNAARERNRTAFDQLWTWLGADIRRACDGFVRGRMQQRVDASDIFSMASWIIWDNLPQFRGDEKEQFLQWCRMILRSARSVELKRNSMQGRSIHRESPPPIGADGQPSWGVVVDHEAETPSEIMGNHESIDRIRQAIELIGPIRQREAVRLKLLEHLTESEVAVRMGLSRQAVTGLMARGKKTLRDILDQDGNGSCLPGS